ncbi:MAG TPA: Hsp20/alpha crystallin family protein [Ktedonobacterales bacterium]|nr:Hsp20/alpha crystallin family protein [Ktedonobacterales bacterium]
MANVTREPIDAFAPLRHAVNRFMEEGIATPERALFMLGRTFPVDVIETPDEYLIEASLQGIRPEDVQITTSGNTVTIRAGRKAHRHAEKEETYLRRERLDRFIPEVGRTITLPAHFDADKVKAIYEHGVLTIHLAKDEETKEHTVQVQVKQAVTAK